MKKNRRKEEKTFWSYCETATTLKVRNEGFLYKYTMEIVVSTCFQLVVS